jgi:outer membrane receptor for ferrienterochelin and colicins
MFLLFFIEMAFSQNASISGKITSEGKPVEFCNVVLSGTTIGTLSDTIGKYHLKNLNAGIYKIVVSTIGFRKQEKKIQLKENEKLIINFSLQEDDNQLNEVVISGTMKEVSKLESAVPVEVYSKAFFKANPTPSLFESLQNINGVRPQVNCNICNTGDIHINGLEGPYTMVLIDGMPLVSGLSTVYGLTGIPQSLIDRMEVVKGPASTLYGSEAVGGLINVITKNPRFVPKFTADVFSSNWGDVNTDLGYQFKASEKVYSLLGVNYFNYQNPIDNNKDGFTDVTLQHRISVFNKWNFERKSNKQFSIAGRYFYEDRWGGQMNYTKQFRGTDIIYGESIYTKRWELFGIYELPFTEKISFQFSTNGHNQNSYYGTTPFFADQFIAFGQLTWNKNLGKNDLLMGASYRYTLYDDNTAATVLGASKIKLPGLFIQDEISINPQHKLLLGMRYDYNSIHGNVFTPRLNYKITSYNKKNVIRFSMGNGYRVANVFTEDHAALTGARTVEFTEDLKPETSWNGNINFVKKINFENNSFLGLDATLFYTYFSNRIIPDYTTDTNKIIYANLDGYAVSQGISLSSDWVWANGLKFITGVTFMDVSITENGIKEQQLLTEKFSGNWSVSYYLQSLGVTIDYTGNVYGPMKLPLLGELDDRPAESPYYSLQNIQLTKTLKGGFEIYGGVKNLLNYTPPANSIARAFDPFDENVDKTDPNAITFDPTYVFAPNQGIRGFLGVRYRFR